MTEPISIAAALKSLVDGLQKVRDVSTRVKQADIREEIVDLKDTLFDAREALNDAREEIGRLQQEVKRLNERLNRRAELVEVKGMFCKNDENGIVISAPLCPVCLQKGDLYVHLTEMYLGAGQCPHCKADFSAPPGSQTLFLGQAVKDFSF